MSFQYNLNYIGGVKGYNKRAIYTLKITDDYFYVNGLIKKMKFPYHHVSKIIFGPTDELQYQEEAVKDHIFNHVGLFDWRLNKKLRYCLVIVLEETTIIFAEEHELLIKNAYQKLKQAYEKKDQ